MDSKDNELLTPVVLDFNEEDTKLRSPMIDSLHGTVSPMFGIVNYGFSKLLHEVVLKTHRHFKLDSYQGGMTSSISCELDKMNAKEVDLLKDKFEQLSWRICSILFGESFKDSLESQSKTLNNNLSLRYYPEKKSKGLGAHIDYNFFTIIWADQPGYQVPTNPSLRSEDIRAIGLPSMGPLVNLKSDDMRWNLVDHCSGKDMLIVGIGEDWFQQKVVTEMFPDIQCSVLHRVRIPPGTKSRSSLPYLVRITDKK